MVIGGLFRLIICYYRTDLGGSLVCVWGLALFACLVVRFVNLWELVNSLGFVNLWGWFWFWVFAFHV